MHSKKLFDYIGNYPGLFEVYNVYVELLLEENDYGNAKKYADASLTLAINVYGKNHPQTASAYNTLVFYLSKCGDLENAI